MLAAQTRWTNDQVGIALLVPYLAGGVLSWFLASESHRLGFPLWSPPSPSRARWPSWW
jgi:hypothetical protein